MMSIQSMKTCFLMGCFLLTALANGTASAQSHFQKIDASGIGLWSDAGIWTDGGGNPITAPLNDGSFQIGVRFRQQAVTIDSTHTGTSAALAKFLQGPGQDTTAIGDGGEF